jgi:hypothetical protein
MKTTRTCYIDFAAAAQAPFIKPLSSPSQRELLFMEDTPEPAPKVLKRLRTQHQGPGSVDMRKQLQIRSAAALSSHKRRKRDAVFGRNKRRQRQRWGSRRALGDNLFEVFPWDLERVAGFRDLETSPKRQGIFGEPNPAPIERGGKPFAQLGYVKYPTRKIPKLRLPEPMLPVWVEEAACQNAAQNSELLTLRQRQRLLILQAETCIISDTEEDSSSNDEY